MTIKDEIEAAALLTDVEVEKLLGDWATLPSDERIEVFLKLDRKAAEEVFMSITSAEQAELFEALPVAARRSWIRFLAPDDAADMIQSLSDEERSGALSLLDPQTRMEVTVLLAYREDQAGGLMNSRFARLRPDMTVEEAIRYLRAQTRLQVETIYYAFVLDNTQKLLGVASLRLLFRSPSDKKVSEIMIKGDDMVVVHENQDQEEITRIFSQNDYLALPVVDEQMVMKGILTIDDVVQVAQEEATEDFQKIGGTQALETTYFNTTFTDMIRKRAGWLMVLFVGEMFTATAMAYYEHAIAKAVVLALFIPLIISSGGNSGSQASTLVIRAMALGEIRLRDWWRVLYREIASGVTLGLILGLIGLVRIYFWPGGTEVYGAHYKEIGYTVALSLSFVVLWGTLTGSMLPMLLRRCGFDPATASAPFVATLVDVTGLVIYFTVASFFLGGLLL